MKRTAGFFLTALLALGGPGNALADDPHVCALLTAAEVESGTGAKVAPGYRSESPMPAVAGVLKDVPRVGCSWKIGSDEKDLKTAGSVYLSLVRLTPEQAGAGIAFRKAAPAAAKAVGMEVKESVLGDATCTVLVPPPSAHGLGRATGCTLEVKGMAVALEASGLAVKTTPEKVKGLLDKAASRLP